MDNTIVNYYPGRMLKPSFLFGPFSGKVCLILVFYHN